MYRVLNTEFSFIYERTTVNVKPKGIVSVSELQGTPNIY